MPHWCIYNNKRCLVELVSLQITSADIGIMLFLSLSGSFLPPGEHMFAADVCTQLVVLEFLRSVKARVQIAAPGFH